MTETRHLFDFTALIDHNIMALKWVLSLASFEDISFYCPRQLAPHEKICDQKIHINYVLSNISPQHE